MHEKENKRNEGELLGIVGEMADEDIKMVGYSVCDPYSSQSRLEAAIESAAACGEGNGITVDITSFSSAAIVQALDILLRASTACATPLRVIYSEAGTYFPLSKDRHKHLPQDVYLSSGVRQVVILPGFGGLFVPGFPTLLITFLGFDPIRVRGATNFIQPARTVGIVGVPPRGNRVWRAREVRKRNLRIIPDDDSIVHLSTFYYQQTVLKLGELYDERSPDFNIAVCALGSKMHTIGVLLFARDHRDVKLTFPIPMKFHPQRYSRGSSKSWQILFGPESRSG